MNSAPSPSSNPTLLMKPSILIFVVVKLLASASLVPAASNPSGDWLIDPSPFKARVSVSKDGRQVELNNGLLRRVIRLQPNAATVALDGLASGESLLRGVKPEQIL